MQSVVEFLRRTISCRTADAGSALGWREGARIRKQDEELQMLRPLLTKRERLKEQMDERDAYIKQLNDQIALQGQILPYESKTIT